MSFFFQFLFLIKYLNEKDDGLILKSELTNPFNLYPKHESHNQIIDEETKLECTWPEKSTARKLLLSCQNFKLNLLLPLISTVDSTVKIEDMKKNENMINVN